MKKITTSWLRNVALSMVGLLALPAIAAAIITHDGINYSTSGTNATVKRYTIAGTDTTWYKGEIVIPQTFVEGGKTYTVVATAANAFLNCKEVTSIVLPPTCVKIGRSSFKGCVALTADPVPATATSIGNEYLSGCSSITEVIVPAGVTGKFLSQNWAGMTSLKKITFADSDKPFEMNALAFVSKVENSSQVPVEEIYFGRDINASLYANNLQPFHNMKWLKKVTFGGGATKIDATMLQGSTALTTVNFAAGNKIASVGAGAFAGCTALQNITLPEAITVVEPNTFAGCTALTQVKLGQAVTSVGELAFFNTGLAGIDIPATVKSIGANAFQSSKLSGTLTLPEALTAIGSQAFAGTQLSSISIPATVTSIGNAAFAPIETLAEIKVATGNAAFKVDNGMLLSADGTRLLVTAHRGNIGTALSNAAITAVDDYGLAFSPYTSVSLPALQSIGNYGFAGAKIKNFTLKKEVAVGLNAFNNAALEEVIVEEGRNEIAQGMFANCAKLHKVTLPASTTNMMKDCFIGCTALEEMEIPANVNYMEPGSVPATIKSLRVLNINTPALAAGVFTPEQKDVTCKVAASAVEKYKAAAQWQYLKIVADASISGAVATLGCPTGLYFATADGKLKYKAEDGSIVDTKFETGAHAFTLQSYKNRIYVADAGKKFTYQDNSKPLGDGQLFYVNNTNGIFYRVTVLNNVGGSPAEDPFSMSIDAKTNKIYIADRNVGIHQLDADTTGLYGKQPFLVNNSWLPYYNDGISWGSITGGFTRDSKGIYWMTKKFNGVGLLRFTDADIYPEGGAGKTQHFKMLFKNVIIKTAYLDEKNGYYYMFVSKDVNGAKPGVYRIALSKLQNADGSDVAGNEELKIADCELIDNSPVLLEGAMDSGEIANVAQINGDGNNVFWSYVAPAEDTKAIPGSVALDAANPLHKSGIKMIKATGTPVVTFAVEGVEAYGVCGATFVAPEVVKPTSITLNFTEFKAKRTGDQLQLIATVLPNEAADKSVTWTSSNEGLATVDANGKVTIKAVEDAPATTAQAPASETATITATSVANPALSATCVITLQEGGSAVDNVAVGKIVESVKYVNVAGVESNQPFAGVNVVVTRYNDGTSTITKTVVK